jgi:phosphotransferase system enzyme I (PtsI)
MADLTRAGETVLRGIPVSAGVCRGKVHLLVVGQQEAVPRLEIQESDFPHHIQRLEQALIQTRHQIQEVQRKVCEGMGAADASIFDAHLLVLEDPVLMEEVTRVVQSERVNIEYAFHKGAERYLKLLSDIDDDFLRERVADMKDVTARVLNNLLGRQESDDLRRLTEPCIIISHDLAPSTTAQLDKKMVLGFGTDIGSRTSHTAIMAKSLGIPAVVGLQNATQSLRAGDQVLVDGYNGLVIVNPTDQTLFEYGQLVRRHKDLDERLREIHNEPAVTLDGARIVLSANIEQVSDVEQVSACGAEGVGLFRTEFLFIHRNSVPDEEEQYKAYRDVAAALKPSPVIIRTLDLGGDKFVSPLNFPKELNPFLGWRAIRFCLHERELFRSQLRAILRASVEGNVRMMYPMISGLDELNEANAVLDECKVQLRARNVPYDDAMEVGVMMETPSAVMIAESLARRARFFSIGTNDLIQYTLAVDRLNERIAHLYEPSHPAIVQLIHRTVEAARRHGIWTGVCGEMAGDLTMVPLLLGLGVDELSTAPTLVPQVKFLVRRLKMSETRALAEFALQCESASEILSRSTALAREVAPSLFENPN